MVLRAAAGLALLGALPRAVLAAAWPEKAFTSTAADQALTDLFGTTETTATDQISLSAPEIAENGAVVPIEISTTLADVESISIVVPNNPRPLAASFEVPAGTLPEVECRIKMGETSDVIAVVKTSSGLFSTSKEVKVTIGGCGG
jgi:sulfur-oxidizing protein SoxY